MRLRLFIFAILFLRVSSAYSSEDAKQFYIAEIESIVQSRCVNCHRSGGQAGSTSLLFTSSVESNHAMLDSYVNSPIRGARADRLLAKIRGASGHGGGVQVSQGSSEYESFVTYVSYLAEDPMETYSVSPSSSGNGSISPSTLQSTTENDVVEFLLTPDDGYQIEGVTGTCGGVLSGSSFATDPIAADCSVVANFTEDPEQTFVVSPSATANGSISPSTPQNVTENGVLEFSLAPDDGYQIQNVTGTCGGVIMGSKFVTDAITADCSVIASYIVFAENTNSETVFQALLNTLLGITGVSRNSSTDAVLAARENQKKPDEEAQQKPYQILPAKPIPTLPNLLLAIMSGLAAWFGIRGFRTKTR